MNRLIGEFSAELRVVCIHVLVAANVLFSFRLLFVNWLWLNVD